MFEQGPIRPPSEASSLLVRVTRNCPWNQCLICPAYKGTKFSRRTVKEVKKDIDSMAKSQSSYIDMITSAFLQDADTLIIPTDELVEIIKYLKMTFPKINRITSYARSKSMKKKILDQYKVPQRGRPFQDTYWYGEWVIQGIEDDQKGLKAGGYNSWRNARNGVRNLTFGIYNAWCWGKGIKQRACY
jgi:hypothetical protein